MSIRPNHLVLHLENICYIELYYPNLFSRQFGYDQLYLENLNTSIRFEGNLLKGPEFGFISLQVVLELSSACLKGLLVCIIPLVFAVGILLLAAFFLILI